jgi:hypothetical protein
VQLEDYLEEIRKKLKSRKIYYYTGNKSRYEIEVDEDMADKMTESNFNITSKNRGKMRY